MNKQTLTETDIRTKFITPAIVGDSSTTPKWDIISQIREEVFFTKGRIINAGAHSTPYKSNQVCVSKPSKSRIIAVTCEQCLSINSERVGKSWPCMIAKSNETKGTNGTISENSQKAVPEGKS